MCINYMLQDMYSIYLLIYHIVLNAYKLDQLLTRNELLLSKTLSLSQDKGIDLLKLGKSMQLCRMEER
jgi:hypothetical protein